MQALRREIRALAPYDVAVLILGESGTGKELIARALHAQSPRARAPFVPVHCATLRGDVFLSHLFGHERGVFPGAVERRRGVIREAEGGTDFLDEVGELSPEAQGTLLRVLEGGEIHAVGAARPVQADVRFLAATHRNLPAWVTAGRFREDLFYRLREAVIEVSPLRARLEDLPLLVEHLRVALNAQRGLAVERVRPATLARLAAEPWPGERPPAPRGPRGSHGRAEVGVAGAGGLELRGDAGGSRTPAGGSRGVISGINGCDARVAGGRAPGSGPPASSRSRPRTPSATTPPCGGGQCSVRTRPR